MCALNKDVGVGVEDQANGSIYRSRKCIYFVLVSTANLRMHNAMILAFSRCFARSVGCDKMVWA